ncbi:MAG: DoxX family protein [Anaerolineales bacterium]
MDIALWIIQAILGIKLASVAFTHGLRHSMPTMQAAIQKLGKSSVPLLYGIAVCTLLGAAGLILPGLLGASNRITSVTAGIMAFLLLLSIFFHVRSREKPNIFVSVILFIFAAFVAYGRWALIP